MPKLKTNRAAAKRFRKTAKGHFKHRDTDRNHILTKKGNKRKRQARAGSLICKQDEKSIKKLLHN